LRAIQRGCQPSSSSAKGFSSLSTARGSKIGEHGRRYRIESRPCAWGLTGGSSNAASGVSALVVKAYRPEDAQRLAAEARDRVRFEEDALALADQVYRVARHLANSREDAQELVQETYVRAFRSWASFQPGTNLRAWLLRILTNLNIDRGRRQQRAPQMQPLEANDYFLYDRLAENGDGISDEEQVVERLSQDDIVTALSAVPHDFRDAIVLVDLGDFSYADAAQILDIPVGTVMSRLHRGRRILKRELAESALEEAT
jgi:RNA polymerase sigma-70 factor (ECF subfamily)